MLPYIKVYPDFINVIRELDNGARGRLLLAIMQYANGEEPDELTGVERIAFIVIKGQIDRDADAYEANAKKQSENGKKDGRPKKPTAKGTCQQQTTVDAPQLDYLREVYAKVKGG